ncbi:hypothetical protein HBA92_08005 [Ochrobactrum sp. MR28]|nr:hypothetical protein [Ochrobactrum sp. MR28]MBX8818138.1 hypothetical protein [Ochrobactrum sp. MR31]
MNKSKTVLCFAVIPLFFVIILLILALQPMSFAGMFVYRYQSLLAGFIALAAAFVTVSQMRADARQQREHHDQTIDLMMQPDANMVSKHIYYNKERLAIIRSEEIIITSYNSAELDFSSKSNVYNKVLDHIDSFFSDLEHTDAHRLYNAPAFYAFLLLKSKTGDLYEARKLLNEAKNKQPGQGDENFKSQQIDALIAAETYIRFCQPQFQFITDNFNELIERFKIILPTTYPY